MNPLIILGGGGGAEQSIESDAYFASKIGNDAKLLYIPVAMDETVYTYQECYSWIKSVFAPFGIREIEMFTDLLVIPDDIIESYSAVYIGGGNTFQLLDELREKNAIGKLLNFAHHGGCIYGGSAGAIILGKNINTALHDDPNDIGLKDLTGLNLTNDYVVWCHYHLNQDAEIINYVIERSEKLIAIPEASAVAYDLDSFKNIGSESCYIFHRSGSKTEIKVGTVFE